jgi:hypothetical protein
MKKFVIARVLFLIIISSWANQSAASSSIPLFQITSRAFAIPVGYVANVNPDCTFASNPITVGWVGDTSKLGWKVRNGMGFVMGVNVDKKSKTPQKVSFQVKEMASKNVDWPISVQLSIQNNQCVAQALATKVGMTIQNINVVSSSGYLPTEIVVNGLEDGAAVQRQVNFGATEMASIQ